MGKLTAWVKEHPYLAGGIVLGVGILYLLFRGGSSSSGGSTTTNASDVQIAQIEAAANLQQSQAATAQNIAQINANAQTAQVNGAVQVEADKALAQVAALKIAAGVQNNQTAAQEDVINQQTAATVSLAGIQKQVYDSVLAAQTEQNRQNVSVAQQSISAQQAVQQQALNIVAGTGLNHEGSKQQGIINAFSAALGQGNVGSYNNARASSDASSAQASASIWGSILGGASSLAKTFFAA